jgi:hypothetical protein
LNDSVAYYTKKRRGVATFLCTSEEYKGLSKKGKMKMSLFYVEGDRKVDSGTLRVAPIKCGGKSTENVDDLR